VVDQARARGGRGPPITSPSSRPVLALFANWTDGCFKKGAGGRRIIKVRVWLELSCWREERLRAGVTSQPPLPLRVCSRATLKTKSGKDDLASVLTVCEYLAKPYPRVRPKP
jgi:hypothetical protein